MVEAKKKSDVINFYSSKSEYREFSNFFRAPIQIDGKTYPTNEHYFQVQKFTGSDDRHAELIYNTESALDAKKLGGSRKAKMRGDWEEAKVDVMFKCCMAKFTQNEKCKKALLSTGDAKLQEDSPTDSYWGIGRDGKGRNMLGVILMKVRHELKGNDKTSTDSKPK